MSAATEPGFLESRTSVSVEGKLHAKPRLQGSDVIQIRRCVQCSNNGMVLDFWVELTGSKRQFDRHIEGISGASYLLSLARATERHILILHVL